MSSSPPPVVAAATTGSTGVSPMAHVLWSICKCRYTANDFYGSDVSSIDVPQLHKNVAARVSVSASPHVLLIVEGRLEGVLTKMYFKHLGIQLTVCSDPLVAYHKYLTPSRRAQSNFDMVIADWGIGNPTTALDLMHFVRRDGNHQLCFVALCGRNVLAGAAIRSGADLFLRKPLVIHSTTLQRMLLPRSMSLPGFPVVLLRQQANHQQLKAVFDTCYDDDDGRSIEPSYAAGGAPQQPNAANTSGGMNFLAAATSTAAATQRLVDEIIEEVEMDELEGDDDGSSQFVNNMILYLKAQDPKHANDRWHRCLQSSMESLQHATAALKRVSEEARVCRRQAEVCWLQHRDVPTHMMSDHLVSGISRRELIVRCLQLTRRNEELERSLHLSESSFQDICRDSASLKAATQAIIDQYQLQQRNAMAPPPPLPTLKPKKPKKPQAPVKRRDSFETSSVEDVGDAIVQQQPTVAGSASRGTPTTGAGRSAATPTTDRSPPSSRNSGSSSNTRASAGRPPLKPRGSGAKDSRRVKALPSDTIAAGLPNLMLSRLSASLEKMLMEREDRDSSAIALMKVPDQIAFRLSWPPLLRNHATGQTLPQYHSIRGLLQSLLSECTLMSQRMLAVAPITHTWLEEFEAAVHGVLGSDPTPIFETPMSPASDSGGGVVAGGRQRKATVVHEGGGGFGDTAQHPVPQPPANTAEGSFRGGTVARLQHQLTSSGSFPPAAGGKKAVAKTVSEMVGLLHAAMLRQAATMETRVSRTHMASRFFLWQGFGRGRTQAKEANSGAQQAHDDGALVGMPSASDEATRLPIGAAEAPPRAQAAVTQPPSTPEEGVPLEEAHASNPSPLAVQPTVAESTSSTPVAAPKRTKSTAKSSLEAPQAAPLRVA